MFWLLDTGATLRSSKTQRGTCSGAGVPYLLQTGPSSCKRGPDAAKFRPWLLTCADAFLARCFEFQKVVDSGCNTGWGAERSWLVTFPLLGNQVLGVLVDTPRGKCLLCSDSVRVRLRLRGTLALASVIACLQACLRC